MKIRLIGMLVLVATLATLLASCENGSTRLGNTGGKFKEIYDSEKIATGYYDVLECENVKLGNAEILDTSGKLVLYRMNDSVKLYNIDDNNVCLTLPHNANNEYELYEAEYFSVWNTTDSEGALYNSKGKKLSDLKDGYMGRDYNASTFVCGDSAYVLKDGKIAKTYNIKPNGNSFIDPSLYTFGEHYAHRITNGAVRFFDENMREVSSLEIPGGASDVTCYQFGNGRALIFYREATDGEDYSYSLNSEKWRITQGVFDIELGKLNEIEEDVVVAYILENREMAKLANIGIANSVEYLLLYLPIYDKMLATDEDDMRVCTIDANGNMGYALDSFIPGQIGMPVGFAGANCYAVQTDLACKILSLDGEEIASFDGEDLVLKKSFGYVKQSGEDSGSLTILDKDGKVKHSYTNASVLANGYNTVIYATLGSSYRYIDSDEPSIISDYLACGIYVGTDKRLYDLAGNDLLGAEISNWRIISSSETTVLLHYKSSTTNKYEYLRITIDGGK